MDVDVWHRKLWEAIPVVVLNLRDDEIEQIRQLCCVDVERRGGARVRAPQADAARWLAATEKVVAAVDAVAKRDLEAYGRQFPPFEPWQGLAWRLKWGLRRDQLRREYEEHRAALAEQVRQVYRAYREEAGDLTAYVAGWRERQAREQREREELAKAERVAAVRDAVAGPVWAYVIGDYATHRRMLIWLPAVEHRDEETGDVRRGLAAVQVQQAIDDERAADPYLWIRWKPATGTAMKEWHGGDERADVQVKAWAALTGSVVEPTVWRPGELEELRKSRTGRGYGPSSNYWSPSSFGTSF
jgi:hypothetical protein